MKVERTRMVVPIGSQTPIPETYFEDVPDLVPEQKQKEPLSKDSVPTKRR